jgi:hypothetical protein
MRIYDRSDLNFLKKSIRKLNCSSNGVNNFADKTFCKPSANTVKTQAWIAVCTYVLNIM